MPHKFRLAVQQGKVVHGPRGGPKRPTARLYKQKCQQWTVKNIDPAQFQAHQVNDQNFTDTRQRVREQLSNGKQEPIRVRNAGIRDHLTFGANQGRIGGLVPINNAGCLREAHPKHGQKKQEMKKEKKMSQSNDRGGDSRSTWYLLVVVYYLLGGLPRR